mmetsp:Transcript_31415/g.55286  ORF Transcript_31415/g.55286 Transcript_31415/m.55286 type:complete len:580 (-) Transcript_31415:265-2004(-)|eukprot:CAMPEP_0197536204 /NCGR_PEP_ID=MMETSP1318-20131121/53282_1 /TAXON_ID=552666 /ORGANISM="Partenskyella glossopodia, Strain RCC365" /LENGTH=579 /DNA_ID=CAMNT_0043094037 /DNA_START=60 /DNA_END=1799 /DNA_ORIENTATION=-
MDYKGRGRTPFSAIAAFRQYMDKIIGIPGMKALLVDKETMTMVSLCVSQTEIISKQVFIVQPIDSTGKQAKASMNHLKAVCLVRPTKKTLLALETALRNPKFKEYHIFFTNFVPDDSLRVLAKADEFDLVKQVQEYYADFYPINKDLWHVNEGATRSLYSKRSNWTSSDSDILHRNIQGALSLLLSAKKRPLVRYQKASALAKAMAIEMVSSMKEENEVFDFRDSQPPILLILDRREDPITPLLMQWTYQAMVHELLGIENNRVDMHDVPDVKKDMLEVVMSITQDEFFAETYTHNFGDLGKSIKDLVNKYKEKKGSHKIETIQDMQRFVEQYPELKTFQGNVTKHVAVMVEMNRRVKEEKLMAVSEVEQNLACDQDHSRAIEEVMKILGDPRVSYKRKVCVASLYHLRYHNQRNEMHQVRAILKDQASTSKERMLSRFPSELVRFAGAQVANGELYKSGGFMSMMKNVFSGGLNEIENVYTRYKPLLSRVLENLIKGKLDIHNYPFMDAMKQSNFSQVFVYIIGGATYSEAALVAGLNKKGGPRVILGGSCIHNSESFMDDVLGQAGKDDVSIDVAEG